MDRITKVISILGLCTIPIIAPGCIEYVNLKGRVINDKRESIKGSGCEGGYSDYNIWIDTDYGKKSINVSGSTGALVGLDGLIEKDTQIELIGIDKSRLDDSIISLDVKKVRVLSE